MVQEALRQHLFYHLLNYTLDDVPSEITVQQTLHFPALVTEPPTKQPPPQEPWLPVPGGLLGNEAQRLRTTRRDNHTFFGVNALGQGGSQQSKDLMRASNGVVYGIDSILDLPGSLLDEIRRHPRLTTVSRLLSDEMEEALRVTPHMTLFFPVDEAWEALDPIERRYLESGFAQRDMEKIVQLHASVEGPASVRSTIGWSQNWKHNGTTKCQYDFEMSFCLCALTWVNWYL
jgi:solute carrier family 25 (mitochondrial carnitine/acylcarnitine transporter), member 20/29